MRRRFWLILCLVMFTFTLVMWSVSHFFQTGAGGGPNGGQLMLIHAEGHLVLFAVSGSTSSGDVFEFQNVPISESDNESLAKFISEMNFYVAGFGYHDVEVVGGNFWYTVVMIPYWFIAILWFIYPALCLRRSWRVGQIPDDAVEETEA